MSEGDTSAQKLSIEDFFSNLSTEGTNKRSDKCYDGAETMKDYLPNYRKQQEFGTKKRIKP